MRQAFIFLLLVLSAQTAFGQVKIHGTVSDATNQPLPGASIVSSKSGVFAIADATGNFTLEVPSDFPVELRISYVTFKSSLITLTTPPDQPLTIVLEEDGELAEVLITARRRSEEVQKVPIPITVINGIKAEQAGAFNVERVKELIPSVQLYSSNPRNTTLNIRGLGSTFGLTNDGIDPGVGFYVDGVYYARPAATTMNFIDLERIEVLRGPQGTLFGKNTTSGAFNITTGLPEFTPSGKVEVGFGNLGYIQAKTTLTGPLSDKIAGRVSLIGTQRNGTLENVSTGKYINDMNNLGFRGKLLFVPSSKWEIVFSGDASFQRPDGYAQVIVGVADTQYPDYRKFSSIIADLNYRLPSEDAFDRKIDHDTPWRSKNDLGGGALDVDYQLASGTLTSTSAWRYWKWGPSNDRDFTGLSVLSFSQAPSIHRQWSQEFRYAGELSKKLSGVFGLYFLGQTLNTDPYHTEESGDAQWRFSQRTQSELWATPGLFDGYGIRTTSTLESQSAAVFGQLDWEITKKWHLLTGLRYNYDNKDVSFDRQTYGGLETDNPELLVLKASVYTAQKFDVKVANQNLSGQVTLSFFPLENLMSFLTFSNSYKPVGINLGGLPTENGVPILDLAEIKPEYVRHLETGIKSQPIKGATLNLTLYRTEIEDYQTLVQNTQQGTNRGYLANAEKVSVQGVELEGSIPFTPFWSLHSSVSYTDGIYVSFPNAPVPIEETGGERSFKDISGQTLPGISKWSGSLGTELTRPGSFVGKESDFFIAGELFFRSSFSSSPTPSKYLVVNGYALVNARIGVRAKDGFSVMLWTRNLLNQDYFEQLLPASGSAGQYAGVLGDPVTYGLTMQLGF